jgi:hypothetical protein
VIAYTGAQGFTVLDEIGKAIALSPDKDRNVFVLLDTGQIIRIDENINRHKINLEPQLQRRDLKSFDVYKNKIVIATNDSIFIFTDNKCTSTSKIIDQSGDVQSARIDDAGNCWLLKNERLFRISNNKQVRVDESKGLANNRVMRIFRDNADNFWILTDGKGTFKFADQPFRQFAIEEESMVSSIFNVDDGVFDIQCR